jgi:hypothetical protein
MYREGSYCSELLIQSGISCAIGSDLITTLQNVLSE